MSRLLSPHFSEQGAQLQFSMDGETYTGLEGETIAASLIAQGCVSFKRDKLGQARGLSCGMGTCFECEVSVDGGTATRACLTKLRADMRVNSVDYHKSATILPTQSYGAPEEIDCEVLVVGSGPAGMSAALSLADDGVSVLLVDERGDPGGQYLKPLASSQGFSSGRASDAQYAEGLALSRRLHDSSVRLMSGATAWGAFTREDARFEVGVLSRASGALVKARQLILAAGAFESMPAFPGWTLPGVMTTGAAQGLARAYRVGAGDRVLVAGNGPLNLQLACELLAGGVNVVAVAESAPSPYVKRLRDVLGMFSADPALALRGIAYLAMLKRYGVPLLFGHHISRAEGDNKVERATLAEIEADGSLCTGTEKHFSVDALCLGYGLQPSNELALSLACEHIAVAPGLTAPVRDEYGQTSVPGVYIIGDSGVLGGAQVARAEGRLTARAIAGKLRSACAGDSGKDRRSVTRQRRFQRHLWSIYRAPEYVPTDPDALICRCESVSVATVSALISDGVTDFGSIKRSSRAGMGSCQGRYCQRQLAKLVTDLTGVMPAATQLFEARLPVKPVAIARLAREKPEWVGYRSIDDHFVPRTTWTSAQPTQLEAEVLVIGAGVIGMCAALRLARAGVDVLVVDSSVPFGQASGANAGSLHGQLLSSDIGPQTAGAGPALGLQSLGISEWLSLESSLATDLGLDMSGGLVVAGSASEMHFLERKVALEQRHGIEMDLLGQPELRALLPSVSSQMLGASYCKNEGKINPLVAGPAIVAAAREAGVRLLTPCTVGSAARKHGRFSVDAGAARIRCEKIVNAAGASAAGISGLLGAPLPVRAAPQQMIVTEPLQPTIGLLVAAAQRHLTLKQVSNGNIIIGGGWPAGFDAVRGGAVNLRESIEGNLWIAQHVIPSLSGARMLRSWATIGVMIDGAPILGESPDQPGFFNAVGANGYTMGPILGRITAELILGLEPQLDIRPFLVERFR
ncbi:MAG: FAD-dependent oxidoreductase [Congregibacter sp.]